MSSPRPGSVSTFELIVNDGMSGADIDALLDGWFRVREQASQTVQRIYYDTFDGLLYSAGLTLWHQPGHLVLGDRFGEREPLSVVFVDDPPTPLHVDALPTSHLRSALEQVVRPRVLLEIARIDVRVGELAVLDELEKTVVRLQRVSAPMLRDRLRLIGLRGYDRELGRVVELLAAAKRFTEVEESLIDEAVRRADGRPAGISNAVDVEITADDPADLAVSRICGRLLGVLDQNLPGVLADIDPEFLHDYRVALRRTRAVVRELRGVFPQSRYHSIRSELRWLQMTTGETRDLDVYLEDFEALRAVAPPAMREDLDPLLDVLRERHLQARLAMVRDLRGERATELRQRWGTLVASLMNLPTEDRPDAKSPVGPLAAERIVKVHRRMVKMGEVITPDSSPQEYHDLRKKGKELRYLLELFGRPMFDPEVVRPMIRALKSVQDVLGRHQDREVQIETLSRLADSVHIQPGGAHALLAMGAMIERLEEQAADARVEFHETFAEFASPTQRRLVKETFG